MTKWLPLLIAVGLGLFVISTRIGTEPQDTPQYTAAEQRITLQQELDALTGNLTSTDTLERLMADVEALIEKTDEMQEKMQFISDLSKQLLENDINNKIN